MRNTDILPVVLLPYTKNHTSALKAGKPNTADPSAAPTVLHDFLLRKLLSGPYGCTDSLSATAFRICSYTGSFSVTAFRICGCTGSFSATAFRICGCIGSFSATAFRICRCTDSLSANCLAPPPRRILFITVLLAVCKPLLLEILPTGFHTCLGQLVPQLFYGRIHVVYHSGLQGSQILL